MPMLRVNKDGDLEVIGNIDEGVYDFDVVAVDYSPGSSTLLKARSKVSPKVSLKKPVTTYPNQYNLTQTNLRHLTSPIAVVVRRSIYLSTMWRYAIRNGRASSKRSANITWLKRPNCTRSYRPWAPVTIARSSFRTNIHWAVSVFFFRFYTVRSSKRFRTDRSHTSTSVNLYYLEHDQSRVESCTP